MIKGISKILTLLTTQEFFDTFGSWTLFTAASYSVSFPNFRIMSPLAVHIH
jgi:hypothetical protein